MFEFKEWADLSLPLKSLKEGIKWAFKNGNEFGFNGTGGC